MQLLHLNSYSDNGKGLLVLDIFSKIIQGLSEVAMSILLMTLAGGWKLKYKNFDLFDDSVDFYIPVIAGVIIS